MIFVEVEVQNHMMPTEMLHSLNFTVEIFIDPIERLANNDFTFVCIIESLSSSNSVCDEVIRVVEISPAVLFSIDLIILGDSIFDILFLTPLVWRGLLMQIIIHVHLSFELNMWILFHNVFQICLPNVLK